MSATTGTMGFGPQQASFRVISGIAGADEHGSQLLRYAWAIEVTCILIGLSLAVSAGLEASSSFSMALAAALPFAAAAVVELGRIPLVKGFFYTHGLFWRSLAVVGVLVVGALTFENLMFGFERAFSVRLEEVRRAAEAAKDADRRVTDLTEAGKDASARRAELQRQLDGLAAEREAADKRATNDTSTASNASNEAEQGARAEIARLDGELAAMTTRHDRERAGALAFCKARDISPCNTLPITRQMNERRALEARIAEVRKVAQDRTGRADAERQAARAERATRLASIDSRAQEIQKALDGAQKTAEQAASELTAASTAARVANANAESLRRTSQMHRLAGTLFGSASDDKATQVLGLFSTISAVSLALAGSVLAALHYRQETQAASHARPGRGVVARALRRTLARLRRGKPVERRIVLEKTIQVPVEVPVVKIVEKPVEIPVAIAIPVTATVAEREAIVELAMRSRAAQTTQTAA